MMRTDVQELSADHRLELLQARSRCAARTIRQVTEAHLTYLEPEALCDLAEVVLEQEEKSMEGILIEAGCALGGSALTLASAKKRERPLFVYDVFGLIPPPSQKDGDDVHRRYQDIAGGRSEGIGGQVYYGYQPNLFDNVLQRFRHFGLEAKENNVHLVKGSYADTLILDSPVALAHIDCDWFDSVFLCLHRIWPRLVSGGILVIDDYHCWSGCRDAVDAFFQGRKEEYRFVNRRRLHIIKESRDG